MSLSLPNSELVATYFGRGNEWPHGIMVCQPLYLNLDNQRFHSISWGNLPPEIGYVGNSGADLRQGLGHDKLEARDPERFLWLKEPVKVFEFSNTLVISKDLFSYIEKAKQTAFKHNLHEEMYDRPFFIAVDTFDALKSGMEEIAHSLLPLSDASLSDYLKDKNNQEYRTRAERFSLSLRMASAYNHNLRKEALYRRYLLKRSAADLDVMREGSNETNLEIFVYAHNRVEGRFLLNPQEAKLRITALEEKLLTM